MDTSGYTELTTLSSNFTNQSIDPVCYNKEYGPQVLLSYKIELLWCLLSVIVGLVANSINIVVFTSKNMRTVSSNVYLLMLAISDSMFLITVTVARILTAIRCLYFPDIRFDIYNTNDISCKLLQYMLDVFSNYSAMMILAFTVERYIACYHAIQFKQLCTLQRAWITCVSILVIISVTILPYHVTCMEVVEGQQTCTVSVSQIRADIFVYAYITEMLLYRIIPVIVIAVLNVFIIFKILRVHKQRKQRRSASLHHINNGKCPNRTNSQSKASKEDKHVQLTVMLIIVSSTYVILILPVLVHFAIKGLSNMDDMTDLQFRNYAMMFNISAFAVNFFLYTMGGSVFRQELKSIVFKKCGPNGAKSRMKVSSTHKTSTINGVKDSDESCETLI